MSRAIEIAEQIAIDQASPGADIPEESFASSSEDEWDSGREDKETDTPTSSESEPAPRRKVQNRPKILPNGRTSENVAETAKRSMFQILLNKR